MKIRQPKFHYLRSFGVVSAIICLVFSGALNAKDVPVDNEDRTTKLEIAIDKSIMLAALKAESTSPSEFAPVRKRINLPDLQPRLISFIKECAELDAIPLFELSKRRDRRVFVGVNFDGDLVIQGQLE